MVKTPFSKKDDDDFIAKTPYVNELSENLTEDQNQVRKIFDLKTADEIINNPNPEYEVKQQQVIIDFPKDVMDTLDPLPEGWVRIKHKSSMHLYLHKQSKVITWS